jgi:hypothetical protein
MVLCQALVYLALVSALAQEVVLVLVREVVLVQALVLALEELVQALVQALEVLVQALVQALVVLVLALVLALEVSVLVQALTWYKCHIWHQTTCHIEKARCPFGANSRQAGFQSQSQL